MNDNLALEKSFFDLLSVLFGFAVSRVMVSKLNPVKLTFNGTTIHVHHWILAGAAIGVLKLGEVKNTIPYAFLAGAMLEDFTYRDAMQLVYKQKADDTTEGYLTKRL